MLSRKASLLSSGQDSTYFLGWEEYEKNSYHEAHNPIGIIQMGLAENQLSFDLIESWLAKNKEALWLKSDGQSIFKELALFQDYHGLPALKNALTEFMSELRGSRVKFDPNKLVLTAGATPANETLMFCLANPGDAFLLPTPYYPGFDRDLRWRTEVEIVPVHCSSSNGFRITTPALEAAYYGALKLGLNVKGILITNPSNPLGTTMTRNELYQIINFAMRKGIHIVSDEVYSGTVFDHPDFISIKQALVDRQLEDTSIWKRTHIVNSLSKDLGLPGFRVGMIYSDDEAVVSAATKMSSFGLVSSQTQFLLSRILRDRNFTREYVEENRKRLRRRKEMLVSGLGKAGIRCLKGNAGLFCWVDMRRFLRDPSFAAEKELWLEILSKVGLNVSAGSSCHCSEPGWFRICFANMSEDTLNVAVKRLQDFVESATFSLPSTNYMGTYHRGQRLVFNRTASFINKWLSRLSSAVRDTDR